MDFIILLIFIFQIVFSIIIWFSRSYFIEKGKNIATKQDIDDITKNIEEIKYKYAKNLEIDKVENDLATHSLRALYSQRDEIVFSFYENINKLYQELLDVDFDIINDFSYLTNINDIHGLLNNITTQKTKLLILFSKEENLTFYIEKLYSVILNSCYKLDKDVKLEMVQIEKDLMKNNMFFDDNHILQNADADIVKEYQTKTLNLVISYKDYLIDQGPYFEEINELYLAEITKYYEQLRNSITTK